MTYSDTCSPFSIKQYCHNQCVFVVAEAGLVVFIVLVVGLLLLSVLVIVSLICCIKRRRPAKRYRKHFFFFHLVYFRLLCTTLCMLFIFNWSLYFLIDDSNLPLDKLTRCLRQAVHEAALASGPHTSASLHLWSLQPLKPANLCPLLLPDHILEHWNPAEQLQWWATTLAPTLFVLASNLDMIFTLMASMVCHVIAKHVLAESCYSTHWQPIRSMDANVNYKQVYWSYEKY